MPSVDYNKAVKDGLNELFVAVPPEAFENPVETDQDLVSRGLLNPENGQTTGFADLFIELQDAGIFDGRGALTEKGRAYSLPYAQTLQESDLWAYKIRSQDGVDKPEASFTDAAGNMADFLWDAGAGLTGRLAAESKSIGNWMLGRGNSPELQSELEASGVAIAEGSIKATEEIAALGQIILGHSANLIGKALGDKERGENALWLTRQQRDKIFHDHQAAVAGETLESWGVLQGTVDRMAQIKEQVGPEEFAKLTKQGEAFGQMIDPTIVVPGASGAKAGMKAGFITRVALKAEKTLGRIAAIDGQLAKLAVDEAATRMGLDASTLTAEAARAAESAMKSKFDATADVLYSNSANRNGMLAAKKEAEAAQMAANLQNIGPARETLLAQRQAIGAIPEAAAQAVNRAVQIGKSIKEAPAVLLGNTVERIGEALVRIDGGLSEIAERSGGKAALNMARTGLGVAGYSMGGIPGAAAAVGILGSGDALRQLGKFSRVVGQEMSRARGQIPFWQRVGNAPNISKAHRFLAHLADTATLGGAGPDALRRVGAGTLAAYPSDLLFQYLQDDTGDAASTFQQAFGKSLVLGGSSAALGGMFLGTKEKHRQLAIGDERNFRSDLTKFGTSDQIALYDSIPIGVRRSIATYAATNPNLNWNFTVKGNNSFDTASNTVTVNIASPEPLKSLVAHEINHALVIKNQMEDGVAAMLIGDGQRGGLIRSADGTLDKNFQSWVDAYNTRLKAQGLNPIPLKQAAVEYFVEAAADRVAGMAESGQLGAMAGRTNARRLINRAVDAMLPKIPVLRDLHFKMGGLMETNGTMVAGNGLLAEGLRELPQTKRMVNQMLNRSAGRSEGRFAALGAQIVRKEQDTGGATLPVQKGDKALLDSFVSIFETEEVNGTTRVKYDRAGDPIPVSQATDHARSQLGTLVAEITDQQRRDGKVFAEGELHRDKEGGLVGTHLGADTIKRIEERGILNKEQIRMLKTLNKSVKGFDGSRFSMVYHPAIKKIGKKIRYGSLSPTLRDVVPYQVEITKAGNLIFRLMSVTQLEENIRVQSQSRKGKDLYSGNTDAIKQDLTVVMETHRKGDTTDAYFKEKYGPVKGPEYKNFINGVFGLMASEQKGKNPNFATGDFAKNQVVRSYRLDRISSISQMTGDTAIPMPFMYDSVKLNLFPNGVPETE